MIQLRTYQEKTISALRNNIKAGTKRQILCAPTGAGKTVMFSYIISKAISNDKKCLILTHRSELLLQAGGTLSNFGLNPVYVNPKVRSLDFSHSLYVAMTKTVMARIKKEEYKDWLQSFDLIIIDESHLQEFNSIQPYFNEKTIVIGATATPERKGNQTALNEFYGAIVNEISISELIQKGFLANPISYGVKVDLSKVKTKGGDYDAEQMGDEFTKQRVFEGVYENYQKLTPCKKAIIFSPNVSSSLKLTEELQKKGLPIKHIDGNSKDRAELIKWFKETPNALLSNVGILTAGFDDPTIEVVILYRATKSISLFMQMVGRGSRTTKSKNEFYVLDFGNNILRHGFWEDDREWSLEKKKKKEGVAPVKDCRCGALVRTSAKECPYCGNIFPVKKTKEEIEKIELEHLKKTDIDLYNDFIKFKSLEQKALEKGFKPGWVLYQLKTKQQIINYGKFKGYKPYWAQLKIEQIGERITG